MLTIRDFVEADLTAQDSYFGNASDEYLERLGVDPQLIRSQKRDLDAFRRRLTQPVTERQIHAFVFEAEGNVIGSMTLKQIEFGKSCDAHGHIYDREKRQKSFGKKAFLLGIDRSFEMFQLKMIFFEPSSGNPAPNALLQSLGLAIVDSYDTPAGGILTARHANRYEIDHDWFYKKLKPKFT